MAIDLFFREKNPVLTVNYLYNQKISLPCIHPCLPEVLADSVEINYIYEGWYSFLFWAI